MIEAIANEPRRARRRVTSLLLVSLCVGFELATATGLAQTNDKPAAAEPKSADTTPPATNAATEAKTPVDAAASTDTTPPATNAATEAKTPVDAAVTTNAGTAASTNADAKSTANAASLVELEDEALPAEMLAVPGSSRPYGMGMSAEAPAVPATIGGRAPSFGAPGPKGSDWAFRLGGRVAGFESFGIGKKPQDAPSGYSGTAIHAPANILGRGAIWAGAGLTLNMTYGNPVISANVNYWVSLNGTERRGFYSPQAGPASGQAYLALTPPKLGKLQLTSKVGVFTEMYGGVGQWGWGVFGPLLAVRGFGESIVGEIPINNDYRFWFSQGASGVPAIQENTPRGDYTGWIEPAKSSLVVHEHVGVSFRNNHGLRLHHARIWGIDDREYMDDNLLGKKRDGHMDVFLFDVRTRQDPYGHLALAGAMYDLKNGKAINDGIWWGIDWTQGASQQIEKFLGTQGAGTGRYGVLSAQWDFSLARMLWHPRNFDGRHPDIRGSLAGLVHKTFATDDALFKSASGYAFGLEMEYVLLRWLGVFVRSYGESRDARVWQWNEAQTFVSGALRKFEAFSVMPGLMIRSDWVASDSIQIAYQRRWYGRDVDNNPAAPLDRDVITIGATAQF